MIHAALQGVGRSLLSAARRAVGMPALRRSEDRRILEEVILPVYAARPAGQRVLFVGCAAYTQRYADRFSAHEYWTIDPVASRRRFGSERHIIDFLQNLDRHVEPDYFDLIICNGVLGWGLNSVQDADMAFATCHHHLRARAEILVGWNDVAPRNRVRPEEIPALRRFKPHVFEPLGSVIKVPGLNRHVFSFYLK